MRWDTLVACQQVSFELQFVRLFFLRFWFYVVARVKKEKCQLWHDYAPPVLRLCYVRDVFFFGSTSAMAKACGVVAAHLRRVLSGHSQLTLKMAASLVSRLGLSAEWLLCGTGSVFSATAPHVDFFLSAPETKRRAQVKTTAVRFSLELPAQLSSPWVALSDAAFAHTPRAVPFGTAGSNPSTIDDCSYVAAARAIYTARANLNCVGFFLAVSGLFSGGPQLLMPFFDVAYSDFVVVTLSGVLQDLVLAEVAPAVDVHAAAKRAFCSGAGYGASLAADLRRCTATSLVVSLSQNDFPFFVAPELGELSQHSGPVVAGAELGAAVGAAGYADSVFVTELLRQHGSGSGAVFVLSGEVERGARYFLQRLAALDGATDFTFILFSDPDSRLATEIDCRGGSVLFLGPPTVERYEKFFSACSAIYTGA